MNRSRPPRRALDTPETTRPPGDEAFFRQFVAAMRNDVLADSPRIGAADLQLGEAAPGTPRAALSIVKLPPTGVPLEDIERMSIVEALKMSNWIQKDAAELLAISPRVMNYKIKALKIHFPRGRRAAPLATPAPED